MYLGIDIGTSAIKAVLFRPDDGVVADAEQSISTAAPQPLWSEQDPCLWWEATLAACERLRAGNAGAWRAVEAIGLSGQMHGAVCMDQNGRVIRPAILWNDGRSHAESVHLAGAPIDIEGLAGSLPMPGFTAPKILWLRAHEPDHYAHIRHILLPKDYVRWRLSEAYMTDVSDAAGTMWLDQAERRWSAPLCEASATDPDWLPDCVEGCAAAGELSRAAADALGLRPGLMIAGGGGDAACGAIGIGAVDDGDAFISLGTSGQIFVAGESYHKPSRTGVHAFAHCIPDRWYRMAALLNGAAPMLWWSRMVGAPIDTLLAEAEATEPEDDLMFLPYLCGERTPHNDPHVRGAFSGIGQATTRAGLTRAVLEGIAYAFGDAAQALADTPPKTPAVIGGGARGDLMVQTLADVLNIDLLRHSDVPTGPALGAARLAALADGAMELTDLKLTAEPERVFSPDPERHQRHQRRMKRFSELYASASAAAQPPRSD